MAFKPKPNQGMGLVPPYSSDPTPGIKTERGGAMEAAASAVNAIHSFLFGIQSDVRSLQDAPKIRDEVSAIIGPGTGVLLVRHIGKKPNGAGGLIPEYLGIQVARVGESEAQARQAYQAKRAEAMQEYTSPLLDHCTPENPTGEPKRKNATMSVSPKGQNMEYRREISNRIMQYRTKIQKI